jgi:hypothetical protein
MAAWSRTPTYGIVVARWSLSRVDIEPVRVLSVISAAACPSCGRRWKADRPPWARIDSQRRWTSCRQSASRRPVLNIYRVRK